MKKNLSLLIALLMVLAIAVPAFAFTADAYEADSDESPFELSIMLVDYEEGYISKHVLGLPPTDRGYARNQVICAVASLYMPKEEAINSKHDYTELVFGAEKVSLDVQDNNLIAGNGSGGFELFTNLPAATSSAVIAANVVSYPGAVDGTYNYNANEITIDLVVDNDDPDKIEDIGEVFEAANANRNFTANFAVFGKVIDDGGIVYVELNKDTAFINYRTTDFATGNDPDKPGTNENFTPFAGNENAAHAHYILISNYIVVKEGRIFYFYEEIDDAPGTAAGLDAGDLLFHIEVDNNDRTKEAVFYLDDDQDVGFEATERFNGDVLFANNSRYLEPGMSGDDRADYSALLDIYKDHFVDEWGFQYDLLGNVLKNGFFETNLKADDLYDEVEVMPYQDAIQIVVPPAPVVDPPKVG